MEADAPQRSVDAIERAIGASPFIESYDYLDRDATYAEFSEFFADQPEVVALVDPEQLPTRFEVMVRPDDAVPAVAEVGRSFETVAGVEGVDLPAIECARLGR